MSVPKLNAGLTVSAILLASGLSRRMGGVDKLLLPCPGAENKSMLQVAVDLMDSFPFWEKILVSTPKRFDRILCPNTVQQIINPEPEAGQSKSVRMGVEHATGAYYLFIPADQPLLHVTVFQFIIKAAMQNPGKIIYPLVDGKPCNPVMFPNCFRDALCNQHGDVGGRKLISPSNSMGVNTSNPEYFIDIDYEDEYKKLIRKGL